MNPAAWRVLRTLVQGATAAGVIGLWQAFAPWPLTDAQMAAVAPLLTVALTVLASTGQNTAEDAGVLPKLGPKPDSGPGNPPPLDVAGATGIPIVPAIRSPLAGPLADPALTREGMPPPP